MWSLARREQSGFQTKSQQTCKRHRALKLCAIYPQSCMEFWTILGIISLMASSLKHAGQIQSLHHQNLAPWPKTAFDIAHILFATLYFLRIEILELTATKHMWTYLFKCME